MRAAQDNDDDDDNVCVYIYIYIYIYHYTYTYVYAASNIEQVLEAALHKTAAIWPPTTHLENYPSQTNQTCQTLLEK